MKQMDLGLGAANGKEIAMKRKWMLLVVVALGLALMPAGSALAAEIDLLNVPPLDADILCNPGEECPANLLDPNATYWHFVAIPNDTSGTFIAFDLDLGGATPVHFDNSDPLNPQIIYNGKQGDNVFVMAPGGNWAALQGGTAEFTGATVEGFNLSHVCVPTPEPSTLLLLGSGLLGLGLMRRRRD